jgi:Protein of unknown function (DUF2955)
MDDALGTRRRWILRVGLAVSLGLVIGEAQEAAFSFLTPFLAFQLLIKAPQAPSVRQGIGFVLAVAIASIVALSLANALQDRQVVYVIVLGLIYFGCFLLQLRGKGGPLPGMLLICNAMVPVLAVISRDLAQDFVSVFILSAASAVLLAWLAHAAFPDLAPTMPSNIGTQIPVNPQAAIRTALACTIILMPAAIHYLANDDEASIVVLITIIGVLGQRAEMRRRAALGLLLGNLIGGLFASVAYYAVVLVPSLLLLFFVTLAVVLLLAEGATRPIPAASIFAIAMPTFLILLGLGLTPITDGSGAAFVNRVIDVGLASLYALAGVALLLPLRNAMREPAAVV